MNELPPHKKTAMKRLLAIGASIRVTAAAVGCSNQTVIRYSKMWMFSAVCGCGKPAGHNGWCTTRLDFSPIRRGWLKDRWNMRGDSEVALTVDAATAAASKLGHQLGQFVWAGATAASVAFSICRTCGKEVRIFNGQSQWERYEGWERYAGGAVQTRCRTEEERAAEQAARQEKRQWQRAKRTLAELRTILRDQSRSQTEASTPEPTSRR